MALDIAAPTERATTLGYLTWMREAIPATRWALRSGCAVHSQGVLPNRPTNCEAISNDGLTHLQLSCGAAAGSRKHERR